MSIDDKTIDRIANLAKLSFNEKEKVEIKNDLTKVLAFVDKLNEVNTDNVKPLIYMNEVEDELRDDVVNYTVTQKQALENAPQKDSDYIMVPKVLKKG